MLATLRDLSHGSATLQALRLQNNTTARVHAWGCTHAVCAAVCDAMHLHVQMAQGDCCIRAHHYGSYGGTLHAYDVMYGDDMHCDVMQHNAFHDNTLSYKVTHGDEPQRIAYCRVASPRPA